jgi:hypothetical protein
VGIGGGLGFEVRVRAGGKGGISRAVRSVSGEQSMWTVLTSWLLVSCRDGYRWSSAARQGVVQSRRERIWQQAWAPPRKEERARNFPTPASVVLCFAKNFTFSVLAYVLAI